MTQFFGILNITPDSFSDGGHYLHPKKALAQADQLITDGADYIDVGGESTCPNAIAIAWKDEWDRIGEILKTLLHKYPGKISLDTKNWQTAERFLRQCGTVLNDVSGFQDPRMVALAAQYKPLVIINHFPGKTTEAVHQQQIDSLERVRDDLLKQKQILIHAGVSPEKIVLDPGIGFGKTTRLNWQLLEFAKHVPEDPVMIGYSRKRFLGAHRFEREPNIQAAKAAMAAGACFLRGHEVIQRAL